MAAFSQHCLPGVMKPLVFDEHWSLFYQPPGDGAKKQFSSGNAHTVLETKPGKSQEIIKRPRKETVNYIAFKSNTKKSLALSSRKYGKLGIR